MFFSAYVLSMIFYVLLHCIYMAFQKINYNGFVSKFFFIKKSLGWLSLTPSAEPTQNYFNDIRA